MDRFSKIELAESELVENGFTVFDLHCTEALEKLKQRIFHKVQEYFPELVSLDQYHLYALDDDSHHKFQYELFEHIKTLRLHFDVIKENFHEFSQFVGRDMDIQVSPYIRIARPHCPQDNIGFHRDTLYGNSAYEASCLFPLTNCDSRGVLKVYPKSHLMSDLEVEEIPSTGVYKGSDKNKMGFIYHQKKLSSEIASGMKPQEIRFGQCMFFSTGLLHGQEVNEGEATRWSLDFRLKNPFTPSSKTLKKDYYTSFYRSPLSSIANDYYLNNENENELLER